MRLSRTTWIILGAVIFIIAFGILYLFYSRQLDEQEQLRSTLATNQATLPKLIAERENWQSQLVKLQNEITQRQNALAGTKLLLTKAQSGWPKAAESIEYDEKLFGMADSWNLDITVVTAAEPSNKKLEGITFGTASFTVSVTGKPVLAPFKEAEDYRDYLYDTVDDILAFIHTIVNDKDFATATIELVSLEVPEPLTKEELAAAGVEVEKPTATVTLTVYTYK